MDWAFWNWGPEHGFMWLLSVILLIVIAGCVLGIIESKFPMRDES